MPCAALKCTCPALFALSSSFLASLGPAALATGATVFSSFPAVMSDSGVKISPFSMLGANTYSAGESMDFKE
jgi:hypothetical protein